MGSTRFDVEKLTDKVDFSLWKMKVKALLTQQGLGAALMEESASGKEKVEDVAQIKEKAHSLIILCLGDKALREVSKETTAIKVWQKLETLYNCKTLANRLYLKQRLFSFKMTEEKSILKQVDEFNKLIDDLENIEVQFTEEDKALILLSSLPKSFENFKDTLLFGSRQTITLEEVQMALKCKDLQKTSVKVWIYILKSKDEACGKFKEWVAEVENKTGKSLKNFRTDNGLEFLSEEFQSFCRSKGIMRHRTVPGTPQQNGIAERLNQTLLERVRCMMSSTGLEKPFWGEIVTTAAYLLNRSPSSALNFKTPQEMWSGSPASYSYLRAVGCLAYAHVKQDKLEPRAIKCVFIGYPTGTKGYKLWDIDRRKLIISRDVTFDESHFPLCKTDQPTTSVEVIHSEEGSKAGVDSESSTDEASEQLEDGFKSSYKLARDRTRRIITAPIRYRQGDLVAFALYTALEVESYEPQRYSEAVSCSEKERWIVAVEEELQSLSKNQTWKIVTKPKNQRLIGCRWLFKKKPGMTETDGVRYKARLVAKGFSQKEGVDYNEIFSPVVKHCSIRILLAITAHFNLELHQMDVTTAFLHGRLHEDIYMQIPEGVHVEGADQKACKLERSLYGLKQSPRQWYLRFDDYIIHNSFKRSEFDSCVYFKQDGETVIYLLLYVDDMLIASNSEDGIRSVKKMLRSEFEMKDLGEAKVILGMKIKRSIPEGVIGLTQNSYLNKVLCRYNMDQCKSVTTPVKQGQKLSSAQSPKIDSEVKQMQITPYASAVGSIMYSMVCCRPDLTYLMSVISRFMGDPGRPHWEAVKWALRYIKGTTSRGLKFQQKTETEAVLEGFVDADFAANVDTRKSLTGYVFTLFGTAISWKATHQSVVALSTTEAEYVALTEAIKESLWLKGILSEFGIVQENVTIFCDNQSAIHLAKHQGYHERTKHIDVKLHFVRDMVEKQCVTVGKIHTSVNPADCFTKALPTAKFDLSLGLIGME